MGRRETCAASMHLPRSVAEFTKQVGGFPPNADHLVGQLDQLRREPQLEDESAAVGHLAYDPLDPPNLNYYVTRLSSCNAQDKPMLSQLVLYALARQPARTLARDLRDLHKH